MVTEAFSLRKPLMRVCGCGATVWGCLHPAVHVIGSMQNQCGTCCCLNDCFKATICLGNSTHEAQWMPLNFGQQPSPAELRLAGLLSCRLPQHHRDRCASGPRRLVGVVSSAVCTFGTEGARLNSAARDGTLQG